MKKKILLVIASLNQGGTQKIIIDLFNYWKQVGHDIKIITFDNKFQNLNPRLKKFVTKLELIKDSKTIFHSIINNLKRIYKLRKILKENQESQILSFIYTTNILTIVANFGLRNHLTISERNDPEFQTISNIWSLLRNTFYRFADKVTANSQKACRIIRKYVPSEKVIFIPNHIFFKKKRLTPKKEKIILGVGRLHVQKGFDILIESFYLSKVYNKGWKLVILGEGLQEKFLKQKVKELKLHNNVLFKGFQNTLNWYKKSKIFIMSSRFEGAPNVLLEAMATGVPSIITNSCPGAMYYVKHGISGLIVPSENVLALSKSIAMIVNNKPLQKKIVQGGFKSLKSLANHKKIFKQWEQCIFT